MFTTKFILISFLISCLLVYFICSTSLPSKILKEKQTQFECGFNSMSNSKYSYSTKFFLIMIMFLIFDLEIAILLPSCVSYTSISSGVLIPSIFIILVTCILLMEWMNGIIEWSS